jgi:hypothetical protein
VRRSTPHSSLLLGEGATIYLDALDAVTPDRHIDLEADDYLVKLQRQVELKLASVNRVARNPE